MARSLLSVAAVAMALGAAHAWAADEAGPLVIREENVEWGFDGKTVRDSFVPLSVLIENTGAGPFEGTLTLTRSRGLGQQVGAVIERPLFLSGLSSQWVQFVPFVPDDGYQWTVSWGRGRSQRAELPSPRTGDAATVLLYDPENLSQPYVPLKRFREDLFPVSVTAADALRGVVTDHAPFWQGAREQAFLDWLRRGGRVYLLHGPSGEFPRFPSELALLNNPQERFPVGRGVVQRLPFRIQELDESLINRAILHDDRRERTQARREAERQRIAGTPSPATPPGWGNSTIPNSLEAGAYYADAWHQNRSIFFELEAAARYHRNWWVIYGVALLYLASMYPGCYLIGRRHPDVRMFYAAYVGAAVLFGVAFRAVGQVGGANQDRIRSAAVAHEIDNGIFDVTQWSSVASVSGDVYDVRHAGTGRYYSTCQEIEAVQGAITAGSEAGMRVDIPSASTRTLLHRTRLARPSLVLNITRLEAEAGRLIAFSFAMPPQLDGDLLGGLCAYGNRIHLLNIAAGGATLKTRGEDFSFFLTSMGDPFRERPLRIVDDELDRSDEQRYRLLVRPLIGGSFRLGERFDPQNLTVPAGVVRVYLYAEMTDEFLATGDRFRDQTGYVLYVVDLPT